ncbi:MAG TPA: gephyrin-like molybdotransferase Glp [Micropepsaceae bacterium]|nr:gephyrin-like molybdotransferase Glp [Micropepsaceae bacterium]
MIAVDEAISRIVRSFTALSAEDVALTDACGRALAADVTAGFDQPPSDVSAMDGYAVRAADAAPDSRLKVIGESPAGKPFGGDVGEMEAVRIFTGGVMPSGADAVVIQEDVRRTDDLITISEAPKPGENIRARGLDFCNGEILIPSGKRLTARDIAVIAAADVPVVRVTRKPRVVLFATGDELSRPGEPRKDGGIVASSTYAIQAMIRNWGGEAIDGGILPDRIEAFESLPRLTKDANLIVTQGGASVGDHDLVQAALGRHGFVLDFWKIAMRPGKPLIFGRMGDTPLIGLPGNPVSAMVCAQLFIRPAIAKMLGCAYQAPVVSAFLTSPLPANGKRQDYVRARLDTGSGQVVVTPFRLQDSSTQKIFAEAHALIIRAPDSLAAAAGDRVDALLLDN